MTRISTDASVPYDVAFSRSLRSSLFSLFEYSWMDIGSAATTRGFFKRDEKPNSFFLFVSSFCLFSFSFIFDERLRRFFSG